MFPNILESSAGSIEWRNLLTMVCMLSWIINKIVNIKKAFEKHEGLS